MENNYTWGGDPGDECEYSFDVYLKSELEKIGINLKIK